MSHDHHVSGGHDHGPAHSGSRTPHDPPREEADSPHKSANRPSAGAGDAPLTYATSGVDVDAGSEAVRLLRERVTTVRHPFVLSGIGGFGGVMRMPPIKDGVLVAGCDGVGTKVMLARSAGVYDTIGIDLVAMSANDVSTCGAVPFFFLDYLVVGKLVPERVAEIVAGVDEGCCRAECVLLGGETAEHPGHLGPDDLDLAGFCVGLAERRELWGPDKAQEGDVILGIDSSGLHSNGFSLVRALLDRHGLDLAEPFPGGSGTGTDDAEQAPPTIGEVLLEPTVIYSVALHDLGHACDVHSAAHITGGGFPENVARALPDHLAAALDLEAWQPPAVFSWLHSLGVEHDELLQTFNCGIGMTVVLAAGDVPRATDVLERAGHRVRVIGEVTARAEGAPAVSYKGRLALKPAGAP